MEQVNLIVLIIAILLFIGAIVVFVFIGRSIKNSKNTTAVSFDEDNLKLNLQLETANKELETINKELSDYKAKNEDLLKDHASLSTIASNLDEQIKEKQTEITTLSTSLENSNNQKNELSKEIVSLKEKLSDKVSV